jgi:hypothetical protein
MPRPLLPALVALVSLAACPDPDKGDSASGSSTTATTTGTTGTSGTTGTTTTEPTTGEPTAAECQQDSDCMLVNNCCECSARPVTEEVPPCEGNCLQPTCDALSLGGITVACRSGVCEFANVQCTEQPPACGMPQPTCPQDTNVSVVGDCWGPCVPSRYCEGGPCITDAACGDGWMCVPGQSGSSTCAPIPFECGGAPTCACVAPYLGEFCGGSCADQTDGILCEDGG